MNINWESTLHFHPKTLGNAEKGIPLPTYGNYGGVNYSAGEVGGITPDPDNPPASAPEAKDDLDALFWDHDFVYQQFEDQAPGVDEGTLRTADVTLIKGISALTFTDPGDLAYDPEAGIYAGFATLAIAGQLAASGSLDDFSLGDQLAVAFAVQEAIVNLESGLAAAPNEGRSLLGAFHVFEAKYLDLFF
jgi:hypothetical protein